MRLLVLAGWLACSALPLTAQAPAGSSALTANDRFVYVLQRGVLHQFDATTLRLIRSVRVPPGVAAPERIADAFVEEEPPEEAVEEEEPILQDVEITEVKPNAKRVTKATGRAISNALDWLANHQDEDGNWDADGFMKHDPRENRTDGQGAASNDVGITALALLAFLGDGHTMRGGKYKQVVKRAIDWLVKQQDDDTGLIGSNAHHSYIYDHATATLALVEAYGLSNATVLRRPAQRAINYLESHRNPYSVWRYQPRDNDNDSSVTGWCVMAYKAAKDFELQVNENALKLAAAWFDQVTDPVSGRTGYAKRGGASSRRAGDAATRFPPAKNETLTALALFCRYLLGQTPEKSPIMTRQADLVLSKLPTWKPEAGTVDCYGWLFGSWAMYQAGGRHWDTWSKCLDEAVVRSQRTDGSFAGSWDPIGPWGEDGGRVYSTACLALTLETYYRYARLIR